MSSLQAHKSALECQQVERVILCDNFNCFLGLSLLMISERALQVFKLNPSSSSYYCDWNNWLPIMTSYQNGKPSYFATPAVNHIYALHTAFEMLLENGGMEARFLEHSAASNAIKDAITAIGCSQVPKSSEMAATTMTCVRYPAGVKGNEFLPKVSSYGVSLAGGLHKQIKTEYFRIGHLGPSTRRLDHLVTTITAIEKALADCGHSFQRGAGVAKIKALKGKVPGIKTGGSCCSFQVRSQLQLYFNFILIAIKSASRLSMPSSMPGSNYCYCVPLICCRVDDIFVKKQSLSA